MERYQVGLISSAIPFDTYRIIDRYARTKSRAAQLALAMLLQTSKRRLAQQTSIYARSLAGIQNLQNYLKLCERLALGVRQAPKAQAKVASGTLDHYMALLKSTGAYAKLSQESKQYIDGLSDKKKI